MGHPKKVLSLALLFFLLSVSSFASVWPEMKDCLDKAGMEGVKAVPEPSVTILPEGVYPCDNPDWAACTAEVLIVIDDVETKTLWIYVRKGHYDNETLWHEYMHTFLYRVGIKDGDAEHKSKWFKNQICLSEVL